MRYSKINYAGDVYRTPAYVFCRTDEDVKILKAVHAKIVSSAWSSLTAEEQSLYYNSIGALRAADLNRIEHNTSEVAEVMAVCGYDALRLNTRQDWTRTDYPRMEQMIRIWDNLQAMIDAYGHPEICPRLPGMEGLDAEGVNALEKILERLRVHMENIAHSWKYRLGERKAGGMGL